MGKLIAHGTITQDIEQVIAVCRRASDLAMKLGVPLVLLGESWGAGGKRMNPVTAAGLGAGWGPWVYVVRSPAHQNLKPKMIVRINARTWRTIAHGSSQNYSTEVWDRMARERVRAQFPGERVSSDDECEAILIGHVGTRFDKVGAVLPAAMRKATLGTTRTAPGAKNPKG